MDYPIGEKLKVEFLPSLFQALLIVGFHAVTHYIVGSPESFERAGVPEAGISVFVISFAVIFYYNVLGWRLNEKLVKAVKGMF